jgi:hypothetical protein
MAIVLVVGLEEKVDGVENVPTDLSQLVRGALPEGEEVVHEDIDVGEGVAGRDRRARWRTERHWCREAFERMGRSKVGEPPGIVDKVGHGLGRCAEVGCGLHEAHWKREVEADKGFRVAGVRRDDERELGQVHNAEPDAHVCVGEVDLGHVDGTVAGVGVNDGVQEAM